MTDLQLAEILGRLDAIGSILSNRYVPLAEEGIDRHRYEMSKKPAAPKARRKKEKGVPAVEATK